jgi:hypothetical protein
MNTTAVAEIAFGEIQVVAIVLGDDLEFVIVRHVDQIIAL